MFLPPDSLHQVRQAGVTAETIFRRLAAGCDPESDAGFDLHVVACIMSLAIIEAQADHRPLSETTGLDPTDLTMICDMFFPHVAINRISDTPVVRSADEACLVDLLRQCSTDGSELQLQLAAMIGRRAQSANHLWQDLGLRDRRDLSRLMVRHFRPLASRNASDMKWKKFLYRMICRDAGYSLCTAPSCSECIDFELCFGDESGESRLARARLTHDLGMG